MSFNLFASPTQDDITVGYVDPTLGYVDGVSVCEANSYAKDNPGAVFIFIDGDNNIRYLNINEVNNLSPNNLVSTANTCGGIQNYSECGPPRIQMFGGGGIGAVGNPVIGRDGSLLAVDVISGGHGYQYPPIVAARDDCEIGNGAVLTAVLGETADEIEVYEGEEDFEDYQICEDTNVGYGVKYGLDGEVLGVWDPTTYTQIGSDPIQREIEAFQKALKNPFWTTREKQPDRITISGEEYATQETVNVTFPEWSQFLNQYGVSPVKPSDKKGSDEAAKVFTMEWEHNFPISGEYIFRGSCDNESQVYIDNIFVGNLVGFKENPVPLQKTIQEGNHIIRIDLANTPFVKSQKVTSTVDVTFTVTGLGRNTDLMKFSFVSGNKTFTLKGNKNSGSRRTEIIKLDPKAKFRIVASSSKGTVEQGIIKNGTKNKEGGDGESNKIFADHIQSNNDNDDIQITASVGTFKAFNRSRTPEGRSTFDLTYEVGSSVTPDVKIQQVISPKSWNENPMGVGMIIDAPPPPVPQEQPPVQTGRCPPNPIWTTRFPGSDQKWYPVKNNIWAKFFNRYAISPVLPLDTPGSDGSGIIHRNSWKVEIPYRGYYKFQVQRDDTARIYVDGNLAFDVTTAGDDKWAKAGLVNKVKSQKVFLERGLHTISVELENTPRETSSIIDTKIFSTKDWRVSQTTTSNLKAKFIRQGSNFYLQVDGNGSGEISFVMDVDDNPSIAGLAAKEVIIPADSGKVRFVRKTNDNGAVAGQDTFFSTSGYSQKEIIKDSGTFSAGKKYGPIQIIGAGIGARGPIINNSNRLGIRDADGDDENIKIIIENIKRSSSPSATSQSPTSAGVSYVGPTLFGHIDKRWSNFMNDYSVSPKVTDSLGKFILTWKNVNFSYDGSYKFNFQADNNAVLKIGGTEILKTSEFKSEKVEYAFNLTAGKYDVVIELENVKTGKGGKNDSIFSNNPTGVSLFISKDVSFSDNNKTSWVQNPIGIAAALVPPPCAKKIGGKGVVEKVIVDDPGNGYLPPLEQGPGYPVTLVLEDVIVDNPGINYSCGEDQIVITPNNGAELSYDCDSFGRIVNVNVLNPGIGFNVYPEITVPSETGVNATFRPVFRVVRDPVEFIENQKLKQEALIQVTDLVGLKQTGYVGGRAYYGAVYYDAGIPYAGYYKTAGTQIRVYTTLQESITAQITTPPSAIQRSGTDIRNNDPRLNIPGTIQDTQT